MLTQFLIAFHLVFVIAWFAGLFYLPRLFVYHTECSDAPGRERFKVMERKLYRGIMTPSAVCVFASGTWLAILNWTYYQQELWFWLKLSLVVSLFAYHGICGRYLKAFANDANDRTHVFFRWFNEVPLVVLIPLVLLVVIKPF